MRRSSALAEGFGESWRLAEEGHPLTAKACACGPDAAVYRDPDGIWCTRCGRSPEMTRSKALSRLGRDPRV